MNIETENNSKELATFYSEHIQSINCFTSDRDFLKDELSFLTKAQEQTKIQKRLGQACFDYLKMAQEEEKKRQAVVRQAIFIYVDAMNEAYGTKFEQPELDQMRKKEEEAQASRLFSLQEILSSRTIQLLKHKMDANIQLNNKILSDFLDKLVFQDFDTRNLILKEYSLVRQVNKELHEQCTLVITVDGFIHIFFLRSYAYAKPDCSYKINQQLSLKNVSEVKVEIGRKDDKRRSGVMSFLAWDSKVESGMLLRFTKKDAKEQMLDFIRKMM